MDPDQFTLAKARARMTRLYFYPRRPPARPEDDVRRYSYVKRLLERLSLIRDQGPEFGFSMPYFEALRGAAHLLRTPQYESIRALFTEYDLILRCEALSLG